MVSKDVVTVAVVLEMHACVGIASSPGSPGGGAKGKGEGRTLYLLHFCVLCNYCHGVKVCLVNHTVTRVDIRPHTMQAQYG